MDRIPFWWMRIHQGSSKVTVLHVLEQNLDKGEDDLQTHVTYTREMTKSMVIEKEKQKKNVNAIEFGMNV